MGKLARNATAPAAERKRLDRLLTERGLAETRQKAQALILAGSVFVDGKKVEKAGTPIASEAQIEVRGPKSRYVGRGGLKLEAALDKLRMDARVSGSLARGSSTGGFVD